MITIQEHQLISPEYLEGLDIDELKLRISYDSRGFDSSRINLMRYVFNPEAHEPMDGFYAYYRIGAEWIDCQYRHAIVVTPKIGNIDFLGMFMTCLSASEPSDDFSHIYDIDFDAPPIRSRALNSVLSPLLVVQFLMCVKRLASRGLRKGYVARRENLTKVKGRVDILRSERNAMAGHGERVSCRFDEYSVDTLENRLLKRALLAARNMISLMRQHRAYPVLSAICGHCLCEFADVSDVDVVSMPDIRVNKLYREYAEATRFARMILRHQDIAVHQSDSADDLVPVFRLDMALLFEHYVLALLRERFGHESVKYQARSGKRFVADFLIAKDDLRVIADTKYVQGRSHASRPEYIMQLGGYARDKVLLHELGYDYVSDDEYPVVPCLVLYPVEASEVADNVMDLFTSPVRGTLKFYTLPIAIPCVADGLTQGTP